jgi:hypothetical protein
MSVDHRAMTEHRLEKSRRVVERQRELIAARRTAGHATIHSEMVLATFERSHAALERSLVWIVKEQEHDRWANYPSIASWRTAWSVSCHREDP